MNTNETKKTTTKVACENVTESGVNASELTKYPHPTAKDLESVGVFGWFLDSLIRVDHVTLLDDEKRNTLESCLVQIENLRMQVDSIWADFFPSYLETVANIALTDYPDKGENTQKEKIKTVLRYFADVNTAPIASPEALKVGVQNTLIWYNKQRARIERKAAVKRVYDSTFAALVDSGILHFVRAYKLAVAAYNASMNK